MLEETLQSPLDCKEIKPVHPKRNQSWIFIGRTDAETLKLATWCEELTHWKRPWYWERLKVEGERDDRGWDGWMDGITGSMDMSLSNLGISHGQGSLECYSLWGRKESDMTKQLNWLILDKNYATTWKIIPFFLFTVFVISKYATFPILKPFLASFFPSAVFNHLPFKRILKHLSQLMFPFPTPVVSWFLTINCRSPRLHHNCLCQTYRQPPITKSPSQFLTSTDTVLPSSVSDSSSLKQVLHLAPKTQFSSDPISSFFSFPFTGSISSPQPKCRSSPVSWSWASFLSTLTPLWVSTSFIHFIHSELSQMFISSPDLSSEIQTSIIAAHWPSPKLSSWSFPPNQPLPTLVNLTPCFKVQRPKHCKSSLTPLTHISYPVNQEIFHTLSSKQIMLVQAATITIAHLDYYSSLTALPVTALLHLDLISWDTIAAHPLKR